MTVTAHLLHWMQTLSLWYIRLQLNQWRHLRVRRWQEKGGINVSRKNSCLCWLLLSWLLINRAPVFLWQILPNSAAQFVEFREIPWCYYPWIPYIQRPVSVVDNASKYKKFIVICHTKTHYIRPWMREYRHRVKKDYCNIIKNSAMSMLIILCQALTKGQEHRTIAYND